MKWYTLEELRPQHGDDGLFAMKDGSLSLYYCINYKGKKKLITNINCAYDKGCTLDDFLYWIPNSKLIINLPNAKYTSLFIQKNTRTNKQIKKIKKEYVDEKRKLNLLVD